MDVRTMNDRSPLDETPEPGVTPLQTLCEHLGLAPRYDDFWQRPQQLSDATLRTLLAAVGIDARDDEQARAALQRLKDEAAAQALPPMHVVDQTQPQPLALPFDWPAQVRWSLLCETGERFEGRADGDSPAPVPRAIHFPDGLPLGYHRLQLHHDGNTAVWGRTQLVVCPARCHSPAALDHGERWWGPTVQLYALRSERNWGMGDFTDLLQVIDLAGQQGAAFVGLNPLHALFPHEPQRASPYSPSTRSALNTLYLDIEAIAEFADCEAARERVRAADFRQRLQDLRDAPHVDYDGVAAAKHAILELLFAQFQAQHLTRNTARAALFRAFQRDGGAALRSHALFNALQAHFFAQDPNVWGWTRWPAAYQDIASPEVKAFAQEHLDRVEFFEYLQWQAEEQLQACARRAASQGLPLGLYRDVAVGVNEGGSETWAQPTLHALGLHVGAPPEDYHPAGQDWGLPPIVPSQLRAQAYRPFIDLLRANMRHAGALRLDHVMALRRLFWVPPGEGAKAGTYMQYPLDDLLRILALESRRHHCLVIGEDLGTVPPNFREELAAHGVLSYKPLYFERTNDGGFREPAQWPTHALAVVGTHDLPTLRAWWRGDDIETRTRFHLFATDDQRREQIVGRASDRVQLLMALEAEKLLPEGTSTNPGAIDDNDPGFTDAVYTLIGRSRSQLVGVQLEDVVQQLEQVNVPSTNEQQNPNWRVKLAVTLEALARDARWTSVTQVLRNTRPRGASSPAESTDVPPLASAIIPRATYRIQFHAGMRFADATRAIPYLHALGISHLYASPYLKARAGSTHGYDIVDHNALNPEVGSDDDWQRMCDALSERGMHQMLDVVPNHMGVLQADNAWWLDVLECGQASAHVCTFDIDWHPPAPELNGQVLLPVLGDHYGRVLEAGELQLQFDADSGELFLGYYDHRFPIDPQHYPQVFAAAPQPTLTDPDARDALLAVSSMVDAFGRLPLRDDPDALARAARQRDKGLLKQQLAKRFARHEWLRDWLAASLSTLNGKADDPHSFDALDALIRGQCYRLAFWRTAGDDVNYRRFFDVSTLAALRMERPEVFEATHRTVLRWLREGRLSGLRIDHPDGLCDPQGYFERLQAQHVRGLRDHGRAPRALYVAVEKILADHERFSEDWPVHGGTGYRFSNQVNGLFVDGRNDAAFDALYHAFIGRTLRFDEVLREAKLLIMGTSLASDLQVLTEALHRIAQRDRRTRDFTRNRLREALTEVAAGFPVYRTYIGEKPVSDIDRQHIDWAVAAAKRQSAAEEVSAIDFVREVMLHAPNETDPERRHAVLNFVYRWQQFTAPVLAKSMEDTAFYRYHRLVSLNDVGGDPRRFGLSVAAFHSTNQIRARFLPHTMLGTSTHDSKRSEDVRARVDVLSEVPGCWADAIQRWSAMNRPRAARAATHDAAEISRDDEYLLYQTLVGVWPLEPVTAESLADVRDRVQAYMLKAVREAKVQTSWINPNPDYEDTLARFIDQLLGTLEPNPFLKDLQSFVVPLSAFGCCNSLSQVLLKLTSPGVPDIYQGCELWNFSLVDPDNRRPVDLDALPAKLAQVQSLYTGGELPAATQHELLMDLQGGDRQGRLKLLMTWRLLALRARAPALFAHGGYQPLDVTGRCGDHAVAFLRSDDSGQVVALASRLLATLFHGEPDGFDASAWQGCWVTLPGDPDTRWCDALTGRAVTTTRDGELAKVHLVDAFMGWPFAVLVPAAWLPLGDLPAQPAP
jgi:(1->4)-alpha-D-glucan 1-alpha-D-glucosylmutase